MPKAAVSGVRELRAALGDCLADETHMPPAAQLDRIRAFLEPVFARRYDAAAARERDLEQLELLAGGVRDARAVRLGADARSPVVDRRHGRSAAAGRGLARPVDDPLRQGTRVGRRPRDPCRRRHDPVGHGDRRRRRDRRGAPLLYVAMTRARDALIVSFPQRYYRRPRGLEDPHSYAQLTRFLPDQVRGAFRRGRARGDPAAGRRRDRRHRRRRRVPRRALGGLTGTLRRVPSPTTPSCSTSTTPSYGASGSGCATPSRPGSATTWRRIDSRRRSNRPVRRVASVRSAAWRATWPRCWRPRACRTTPRWSTNWSSSSASTWRTACISTTTCSRRSRRSASRGVKTALVSNCSHSTRPVVERLGLEEVFDRVVLSFEVRAMKPDPAIYRAALEQLGGVPPERAVFVDDQPPYCDGATAVGTRRPAHPAGQRGRARRPARPPGRDRPGGGSCNVGS